VEFVVSVVDGELKFATKSMTKKWNRVLSFYERTGSYFKLSISELEKQTTEGQIKLFKRIVLMVCEDTGNEYKDVQKEFLKLTPMTVTASLFGNIEERNKKLDELTTKEFQVFLEKVLVTANDIMNSNIKMISSEEFGTIITIEQ